MPAHTGTGERALEILTDDDVQHGQEQAHHAPPGQKAEGRAVFPCRPTEIRLGQSNWMVVEWCMAVETSDRALIASIVADPVATNPAWAELVKRYDRRLFLFLRRTSGLCRTAELAEDVKQEVWIRCLKYLPTGVFEAESLFPLLRKMARNAAIDVFRKKAEVTGDQAPIDERDNFTPAWHSADSLVEMASIVFGRQASLFDVKRLQKTLLLAAFKESRSDAHELLVFGFHHHLQWRPREIASDEMVERELRSLCEQLTADFACASTLPSSDLDEVFTRLRGMTEPDDPGRRRLVEYLDPARPREKQLAKWSEMVFLRTVQIARQTV